MKYGPEVSAPYFINQLTLIIIIRELGSAVFELSRSAYRARARLTALRAFGIPNLSVLIYVSHPHTIGAGGLVRPIIGLP